MANLYNPYDPYDPNEYYGSGSVTPPPPANPFQPAPVTGGPLPATPVSTPPTGGPLPATPVSAPVTGGPLPATPVPAPITGGNQPPVPVSQPVQAPPLGGNQPPIPVQPTAPPAGGFMPLPPSTPFTSPDPNQSGLSVQQNLAALLGENSPYIQNARQRGLEIASSRGLLNSSMAAGSSQRAAIEAAMPILNQIMGLQSTREGYQFTGQQNQFNRELQQNLQREALAFQGEQAGLNRNHDFNMAQVQDWLSSNAFSREFYGTLSMLPIKSTTDLMGLLQQYAIENPEVYTPEVMNGMGQFFSQNMLQLLAQYWPNVYGPNAQQPPTQQPAPVGGNP